MTQINDQDHTNYGRIARAIDYINVHFKDQPSLDQVAGAIGVSPYHFQRLFTQWAGVSPKRFMQNTTKLSIDFNRMPYSFSKMIGIT